MEIIINLQFILMILLFFFFYLLFNNVFIWFFLWLYLLPKCIVRNSSIDFEITTKIAKKVTQNLRFKRTGYPLVYMFGCLITLNYVHEYIWPDEKTPILVLSEQIGLQDSIKKNFNYPPDSMLKDEYKLEQIDKLNDIKKLDEPKD